MCFKSGEFVQALYMGACFVRTHQSLFKLDNSRIKFLGGGRYCTVIHCKILYAGAQALSLLAFQSPALAMIDRVLDTLLHA